MTRTVNKTGQRCTKPQAFVTEEYLIFKKSAEFKEIHGRWAEEVEVSGWRFTDTVEESSG